MARADRSFRVGLLGHGTVGSAFARLLPAHADRIRLITGYRPELAGVVTTSRGSFEELLERSDLIVELMGGIEPARGYVLRAIEQGRHVVTANKQLLSQYGEELWHAARSKGVQLRFEGAVAGVVPVIRVIQESLAGARIDRVHPACLSPGHPLAPVDGPFNAITVESDEFTEITMSGPGAGGPETASAVLGDVISAMIPPASTPPTSQRLPIVSDVVSAFYLHLEVADEPGVLAAVAEVLAGAGVSVKSVVQKGLGDQARLVMVVHSVLESRFQAAMAEIARLPVLRAPPRAIRVLEAEFGSAP